MPALTLQANNHTQFPPQIPCSSCTPCFNACILPSSVSYSSKIYSLQLAGHQHPSPSCRPVIALGKFDAMHKGHQALAAAALQLGGFPVMLSFSGMAAVLGWPPRRPLVAPCDRPRVLHLWAQQLHEQQQQQQQRRRRQRQQQHVAGNAGSSRRSSLSSVPQHPPQDAHYTTAAVVSSGQVAITESSADGKALVVQHHMNNSGNTSSFVVPVRQRYIPFAAIRALSPQEFVDLIVKDLGAAGAVCGANYRFGESPPSIIPT